MEEAGNVETTNTGGCGNLVFRTGEKGLPASLPLDSTAATTTYIKFNLFFCFVWEKKF